METRLITIIRVFQTVRFIVTKIWQNSLNLELQYKAESPSEIRVSISPKLCENASRHQKGKKKIHKQKQYFSLLGTFNVSSVTRYGGMISS